jgi:hypothetical protein
MVAAHDTLRPDVSQLWVAEMPPSVVHQGQISKLRKALRFLERRSPVPSQQGNTVQRSFSLCGRGPDVRCFPVWTSLHIMFLYRVQVANDNSWGLTFEPQSTM